MSWYICRTYFCENCGYKYEDDISTFTIAKEKNGKCIKCGNVIKTKSNRDNNEFIEILKTKFT